jgi:hypothetical protein
MLIVLIVVCVVFAGIASSVINALSSVTLPLHLIDYLVRTQLLGILSLTSILCWNSRVDSFVVKCM